MIRTRLGLFLKNGAPQTGPGRYVRSLLKAVPQDEFEVVVFTRSPHQVDWNPGPDELVDLNEAVRDHNAHDGTRIPLRPVSTANAARTLARSLTPFSVRYSLGFTREARRLADLLRRHCIDILHTNETGREESAVAAKLAGVPAVIGTLHVLPDVDVEQRQGRWIHRHLERRGLHSLDLAVAVSDAGRAAWLRRAEISAAKILTVHNGIDPERFRRRRSPMEARRSLGLPGDDSSIFIGTASRLSRVKGLDLLIKAAARLRAKAMPVRVVLAGEGPMLEELHELAAQQAIAPYVHFIGHQDEVPMVMEALDIFAMPSLSEALPYALIEAMSMELPVVASNVGGIPEVVAADQTGLLVPVGDADALYASLQTLVGSPSLRHRMGQTGRQRIVECFDERRMAHRMVNLYRSITRESRACA